MKMGQRSSVPHLTGTADRRRRPTLRWWVRRLLGGGLLVLLVLFGVTWLAGQWAKANLRRAYPPPGQLIDVGGYRLHLDCRGQGSPTVLLEAGLGDFSVQWAQVQPAVADFTRVCTYDRAGLGWSESSTHMRTVTTMAAELDTLLNRARETGPLVLVGHSFGGIIVRAFAQQAKNAVVGMVLVDAAHEAQSARLPALRTAATQMQQQFQLLDRLSRVGLLALAPDQIPNRGLPPAALAHYRARLAASPYFTAALAEQTALYPLTEDAPPSPPAKLGDLPLIVLSRGQAASLPGLTAAENAELEGTWQRLQAELVALSTNSQQQIATRSGHEIHLQEPDLVVTAIRQLVQSAP